jgi:hypothetical protein
VAWPTVVLILAAILAVAGALVAWAVAEGRRQRRLLEWAEANGWTYLGKDRTDRPRRYLGFSPFGQGSSRNASNIFRADVDGLDVEVFDYRYTVQSGKNSHTVVVTVATATMPLEGHDLTIRGEHLGHKLLDSLGGEDIDVEDDDFSRRFWVQCRDRRFAYDVLHPPMLDLFKSRGAAWSWQWRGRTLMLVRSGRLSEAVLAQAASTLASFKAALPRHRLHEVRRAR